MSIEIKINFNGNEWRLDMSMLINDKTITTHSSLHKTINSVTTERSRR